LDQPVKVKGMTRVVYFLALVAVLASCRSAKNARTVVTKKDTAATTTGPVTSPAISDTQQLIRNTLKDISSNQIHYKTFSAKVNVDYKSSDGKDYNVNANIRLYKDSAIWVSANAILGIEAMRILISRDSVKLLDKINRTYTAKSIGFLQEVTGLPLDLYTLQDLVVGNPVFLDSNIVAYQSANSLISLLSVGQWFRNLLTLTEQDKELVHSKLDDVNATRNRTAELSYSNYETKNSISFATNRRITVSEKNQLDIRLDFKQYDFNGEVSLPFSIPKNYKINQN
jgi:outer membrane biogenesis lipoprotein LolB